MKKRIFAILTVCLIVCLFLVPSFIAYADMVVWNDNDFYHQYRGQFVRLGRRFTANGAGGSVDVYSAPGYGDTIVWIRNGDNVIISDTCLFGGEFWGFTTVFPYLGWVKLDQMLVLYDYVAFAEDHFDELYPYTGDYAEIRREAAAVMWPWPGADSSLLTFEELDPESVQVSTAYKDEEGREWGFVSFLYGERNFWICLSDPLNLNLPALNPAPEPTVWVSETAHVDILQFLQNKKDLIPTVVLALVVVVVAGTVVLIKVIW